MGGMSGLEALNHLEAVASRAARAAAEVKARPSRAGMDGLAVVARNILGVEQALAVHLARSLNQPVVTADPAKAGSWVAAAKSSGRLMSSVHAVEAPAWLPERLRALDGQVNALAGLAQGHQVPVSTRGLGASPQPASVATGNPWAIAVASAAASAKPIDPAKLIGGAMFLLSTVGGIVSTVMAYKEEAAAARPFDDDEKPRKKGGGSPEDVRRAAQELIDAEVPGATVNLRQSPDGEWVASVKKGNATMARKRGRTANEAAGEAARAAIDATTEVAGEVVDAEFVELKPRAKAAAEA